MLVKGILAQLVLCTYIGIQNVSASFPAPSGRVLDITEPLNQFKDGNFSKEEFMSALSLGRRSNMSEYKLFYFCGNWMDKPARGDLVRQVTRTLADFISNESTIQLVLEWEIDSPQIDEAAVTDNTVSFNRYCFPNILLTFVFAPEESGEYRRNSWIRLLKLEYLRDTLGILNNQTTCLGLIFLEDNEEHPLFEHLQETDVRFILYLPDIADPMDLEVTYHYFQTEVKPKRMFFGLEMVYFVSTENCTANILKIYAGLTDMCILIDTAAENNTNQGNFFVIPHLNTEQFNRVETYSRPPMLPIALEATSLGFSTFLLNHGQWRQLELSEVSELLIRYKPEEAATPLQVIIDYSEEMMGPTNVSLFVRDWKSSTMVDNHAVTKVKALVFNITGNGSVGYEVDNRMLRTHIADLPSKPSIGCSFQTRGFRDINVTKLVTACKSAGSTVYILKMFNNVWWGLEDSVGDSVSVPETQEYLDKVRKLRNEILILHKEATVYFQLNVGLWFDDDIYPTTIMEEILSQSLFCLPGLLKINQVYTAIITWANVYSFPVILNSALRNEIGVQEADGGWLSFLRKVPRINQEFQQQKKLMDGEPIYTFPIGHNGKYKTDSCINWIEEKPQITTEYFNNRNIGTILHTEDTQHSETALKDVLITMLQFVFHRFRLAEIVCGSNLADVLAAVASLSNLPLNSTVFISLTGNPKNFESSKLAEVLDQIEGKAMTPIKGIHLNLSEISEVSMKEPQLPALFKDKYVNNKFGRVKFGILVATNQFFELIQYSTTEAEFRKENLLFLNQTDYIVFHQNVNFKTENFNKRSYQERMFNEHVNYKRIIQNLFPHLEVYFHIYLDATFDLDFTTFKEYLVLLSHAKAFSRANNFGYFIVEAFDNEMDRKNGWWAVNSGENPANPRSYVEKEAEFSRRAMWYPAYVTPNGDTSIILQTSPWIIVGVSVGSILLLFSVVVGSVFIVRYRNLRQYLSDADINEFLNGRTTSQHQNDTSNTLHSVEAMKFDSSFQLQMSDICFEYTNILGMGNFGTVFKGQVNETPAAIKQPNRDCSKSTFKSVLTEIKVISYLGAHPNVVGFIGAYTKEIQQGILFIATELCSNGSLEKLLRSKRSVISEHDVNLYQNSQQENLLRFSDLARFAMEIANGMEYIESKNIVHGDLAARNILLGENLTCKIGDFGLSRKLYEYQKYVKKSQEPLPWKWMAVESLAKMEFTSKSDVWSFGVLVWEIYSLGDVPYAGLNWTVDFVEQLRNGLRLSIPQFATQNIYEAMLGCWHLVPEQRPTFTSVCNVFRKLTDIQYVVLQESQI